MSNFAGDSWRGGRKDGTILLATGGNLATVDLRSTTVRPLPLEFKPDQIPREPVFLPKGDGFVFLLGQGRATPLFRSALNSSTIDPYLPSARKVSFAQHPLTGSYHIFYNGIADDRSDLVLAPVDSSTGNPCSDPAE